MSTPGARWARPARGLGRARERRADRPLHRALAALAALALGAGLVVFGAAAPASAHTTTVSGVAACDAATGEADVTWTVTNSETSTATVTSSSNTSVVAKNTTIAGKTTSTFVQHGVALGGDASLTIELGWPDRYSDSGTGSVDLPKSLCDSGSQQITFCHADGSGKYETITTDVASFKHGHSGHEKDIHPAYRYVKNGKVLSGDANGDQSLLAYPDCTKPFDWNWQYAAPSCDALVVAYPKDLPAGQANDVNVRFSIDGTDVTLNFHNNGGTWSGTKTFTFADHPQWKDPTSWIVKWVQVGGTNFHWEGAVSCVDDDAVTVCHWDQAAGHYDREYLTVGEVVAAKHAGHAKDIFTGFSYWIVWPVWKDTVAARGDQSLLQYEDCAKPPVTVPVEGAPTFTDRCGPANERLAVPADTTTVDWEQSRSGATITVTATPKAGHAFPQGAQATWTFTVDDSDCVVPVSGEPSYADTCHAGDDVVALPADTATTTWSKSKAYGTWTVTAKPTKGNAFPAGARTTWTFPVDDGPCVVELVGAPTFSDTCRAGNEDLEVPDDTDSVDWEQGESLGVITVTATPQPGYAFAGEPQTVWEFTLIDEPCEIEVDGAPTWEDSCGADNEHLTVPDTTDTIEWTRSEYGGVITVTVTALEGSKFPAGAKAVWTFTPDDSPCLTALTGEPTFTDTCAAGDDVLELPEDSDRVDWEQVRDGATITVTATPKRDWAFSGDPQTVWTFTVRDGDCVTPTLDGSVATGECVADVPWISYRVVLHDPDALTTPPRTVFLVLTDGGANTEEIELGDLDEDGVLEGETLWPGATVDDDGNPTGWPGWEQLEDGTWVETDGNFAWTRDITTATFRVNPELAVDLAYPQATPDCLTAPPGGGEGTGGPLVATGGGAGTGSPLASTGFAAAPLVIAAGVILAAGIALLLVVQRRRRATAVATAEGAADEAAGASPAE
ncbi:hypothetical protein ACDF64_11775 [Agromyces sp. MMS24-JH15]|uniref:hypothetical protein n=1 Tax=Agromyces sp. MMS24-JH15 TaxID=3243765 RepID=UPI0037490049